MPVTNISSGWVSGNLVFYETAVGQSVTGDVFTIGTAAVKVGGTSQDIDFQFYATGSKSFIIDAGAGTLTMAGLSTQVGSCPTFGLAFGAKSSSAAIGHHIGVANSADTAGDKAIAVFADDGNAVLASDAQGINSRCLIMAAQTGAYAMDALRGHLRIVASITPSAQKAFSATSGYVEASGTYTFGDGSNIVFINGMSSTVEATGTATVAANTRLCGILLHGNFIAAYNSTSQAVGVMYEGQTYGFQFALGFHDGVSGMLSTASDSANCTHKIAVWVNGVGTRYIHLTSD